MGSVCRMLSRGALVVIVALAFWGAWHNYFSAKLRQQPGPGASDEWEKSWIMTYQGNFTGAAIPSEWVVRTGQAKSEQNTLVLQAGRQGAEIYLKHPTFPTPSLRVECDVIVSGDSGAEASLYLNGNSAGCAGAYLFQIGAGANRVTRLRRIGLVVEDTVSQGCMVQEGRTYRVVAEHDQGKLTLKIDATEILNWQDPNPVWGPDHGLVGFYTWGGELRIKNLMVYLPLWQIGYLSPKKGMRPGKSEALGTKSTASVQKALRVLQAAATRQTVTVEDFFRLWPAALGLASPLAHEAPRAGLEGLTASLVSTPQAQNLHRPLTKGVVATLVLSPFPPREASWLERGMMLVGSQEAYFRAALRQRLVPPGKASDLVSPRELGAIMVAVATLARVSPLPGADIHAIDSFVTAVTEEFISPEEIQVVLQLREMATIKAMLAL